MPERVPASGTDYDRLRRYSERSVEELPPAALPVVLVQDLREVVFGSEPVAWAISHTITGGAPSFPYIGVRNPVGINGVVVVEYARAIHDPVTSNQLQLLLSRKQTTVVAGEQAIALNGDRSALQRIGVQEISTTSASAIGFEIARTAVVPAGGFQAAGVLEYRQHVALYPGGDTLVFRPAAAGANVLHAFMSGRFYEFT